LLIDNEEHHPPGEEGEATMINMDVSMVDFVTVVCDSHNCNDIWFNGIDSFTLDSCITTILGCQFPENEMYQNLYFYDFFNAEFSPNSFDYIIEIIGDIKTLTLTNSSGDKAVYRNELLSVHSSKLVNVSIYPNPVNDKLNISSPDFEVLYVHIYDLYGKRISNFEKTQQVIYECDMTDFGSGIYFLTISTSGGEVIKKIIRN
tara:strand:- start:346 stop:954 length:609 start_codon:yes stop_codon:yes gene_type:complete